MSGNKRKELPRFWWIDGEKLRFAFHRGQLAAWDSVKRFVVVLAGTQSGKTVFGPVWLWREIKTCGPGDYMVVTPTYKILQLKALPTFLEFFQTLLRLGTYNKTDKVFTVSPHGNQKLFGAQQSTPTQVFFGYAEDPESLESATAKAAWLDEAGQKKFKMGSWEAIMRRLSINQGRVLVTTTLYDLGWIKQKLHDRAKDDEEDIEVVRFDSTENPAFPREAWEKAKRDLPPWKFGLFYRAMFTRPAGIIYDSFKADPAPLGHKVKRFPIPDEWPRYLGVDFGGVNTAALWYAKEPKTGRLYLYREYKHGGRTAKAHAEAMLAGEARPLFAAGGSKSEGQWRDEFDAAGLPLDEPVVTEVEVGIDRVYGFHARDELYVFDDLDGYLTEKETYSRVLGPNDEPTEKIEDKSSFHFMDAERYILSWLAEPAPVTDMRLPALRRAESR